MIQMSPSMLSCDFAHMADEAKAIFKELSGSEQNGIFAILAGQELSNLN